MIGMQEKTKISELEARQIPDYWLTKTDKVKAFKSILLLSALINSSVSEIEYGYKILPTIEFWERRRHRNYLVYYPLAYFSCPEATQKSLSVSLDMW